MIKSLLDTDFYKISMGQVFFNKFRNLPSEYKFVCRNKDVDLSHLKEMVEAEVLRISELRYTLEEIIYLRSLDLFEEDYIDFLCHFKLNPDHVKVSIADGQLAIRISGPLPEVSPWEIYLLATINELYFKTKYPDLDFTEGRNRLRDKIKLVTDPELKIMEFGTRRRFSQEWQEYVTKTLSETLSKNLIGTSNIYLAMKLGLKAVGTQAHEYLQTFEQMAPDLAHFQKTALQVWKEAYGAKLQTALTDVISTDSFLRDLDEDLTKHYTGLRHDSGDPLQWGEKILNHYEKYSVDPSSKTLVFSDGLTIESATKIFAHFKDRTNMIFGIGTSLTNDVGVKPLNIVIKMVSCDGKPVAKISDEPSKAICEDPAFLEKLKTLFKVGQP